MTRADSVLSTPPTNTPVDTTRRHFLMAVGGGTAAMLGATIPEPAALHDPVFGLIEAHRKAGCDHEAALVEQARLEQIGDNAAAWLVSEAPCHAEFNAFDALLSAAATTVPGIVAQLAYLQDIAERDGWRFSDREDSATMLLEGFAASIANILR
jgi:hypothetical protein